MVQHKNGTGNPRQTADQITQLKRFLVEIVSDKEDPSASMVESYSGLLNSLSYTNHVHLLSVGSIATSEAKDFEALIGTINRTLETLLKMLDEKNGK